MGAHLRQQTDVEWIVASGAVRRHWKTLIEVNRARELVDIDDIYTLRARSLRRMLINYESKISATLGPSCGEIGRGG